MPSCCVFVGCSTRGGGRFQTDTEKKEIMTVSPPKHYELYRMIHCTHGLNPTLPYFCPQLEVRNRPYSDVWFFHHAIFRLQFYTTKQSLNLYRVLFRWWSKAKF